MSIELGGGGGIPQPNFGHGAGGPLPVDPHAAMALIGAALIAHAQQQQMGQQGPGHPGQLQPGQFPVLPPQAGPGLANMGFHPQQQQPPAPPNFGFHPQQQPPPNFGFHPRGQFPPRPPMPGAFGR